MSRISSIVLFVGRSGARLEPADGVREKFLGSSGRASLPAVALHDVLEIPLVYRTAQWVFAPGAEGALRRRVGELLRSRPQARSILDIGCGPDSWLIRAGANPVGLDLSPSYVADFRRRGGTGVVASADALPFPDAAFDAVWSVGLLHHLPEAVARRTLEESVRVCRPHGYVALLDAVLPRSALRRPVAQWVRRMDRGRFMRTEPELRALLPRGPDWDVRRFTYALNGLEMLACVAEPGVRT